MLYKLNRRVKVRRWTATKNEFGGLEPLEIASWYKWAEVRGSNWINLDLYNTRSGRPNEEYNQEKWDYDTTIILRYELERPTRSNDTIEYNGEQYTINSISVNNEYAKNFEVIKCSKIDSQINSETPVDTGNIKEYEYIGIGGESTITDSILIGQNVFLVFKDGIQFILKTSGTPIGKEVVYNSTLGTVEFGIPFEEDEKATIIYY